MDASELGGWWFAGKRLFVRSVLDGAGVDLSHGRLLDAGCGTGAVLRVLRPGSTASEDGLPATWGLDAAIEALRFARQKCEAGLVCGSAEAIPFADQSFQMVLMLDVLEHLDDDGRGASEAMRILAPGGHLVVTVPAYPTLWSDHDVALHHRRRYLRRQVGTLLENAGFQVLYLGHAFASVLPVVAILRLVRHSRPSRAPQADVGDVHPLLNALLLRLMQVEAGILRRTPLPFGSTIVALARRD